jgi:threonylcarbamoyladenosine tRNA methylthiotransferase MtaB
METLASRIPHCGIGIDVITGFPGETGACFEETRAFLENLPFSYLHVFTYSERPRTHALTLDGKVPPGERSGRSAVLRELSENKRLDFNRSQLGSTRRALLEKGEKQGRMEGFTDNYIRISVPHRADLGNSMLNVRLESLEGGSVSGSVCSR